MPVTFHWPGLLWGLLLVPALVAVYARVLRWPRRHPVFHPFTAMAAAADSRGARFTRHLPAVLLLAALTVVLLGIARPVVRIPVPADQSAIILSIDSSGSMRSTDVAPTRLDAAKVAAKAFLATLPRRVRVGLVMFGGYAQLLVPPTTDRERLVQAIDGLSFIRRTAIGEGLLEALVALPGRSRPSFDGSLPPAAGPRPPGIIILLTDGRSNTGIDPLAAADIARRQEVTVYTVGVGQPFTPDNSFTIGGPMDEETLKEVARITGGTYHHATSAEALRSVYEKLARRVGWERRPTEAGAVAAFLAAATLLAALVLSQVRTRPLGI